MQVTSHQNYYMYDDYPPPPLERELHFSLKFFFHILCDKRETLDQPYSTEIQVITF